MAMTRDMIPSDASQSERERMHLDEISKSLRLLAPLLPEGQRQKVEKLILTLQ